VIKKLKNESTDNLVSTYAAELEVEVDRLRIREDVARNKATEFLSLVSRLIDSNVDLSEGGPARTEIRHIADNFRKLLFHLNEQAGHAPTRDDVANINLREVIEQVFTTQQRVHGATEAVLHLSIETETILWFPDRLRHILHNLIGNALRFRDSTKGENRVSVAVQAADGRFALRVSDNGVGISTALTTSLIDLPHRAAQGRPLNSSFGLAVVQFLVQQCCGEVELQSNDGQGTSILVFLPRFAAGDYVESAHD
jgi:signal transduction histidine kinase